MATRRRFQFTLSALLALTLIAAIGSAWFATWSELNKTRREVARLRVQLQQQKAVAEQARDEAIKIAEMERMTRDVSHAALKRAELLLQEAEGEAARRRQVPEEVDRGMLFDALDSRR